MFFAGPTGVGKTETVRALARALHNDWRAILKIDCSEYSEPHAVARLIGAPPGYIGYDEAGQLTEAVRRRPYAVVLFDEVEKAHPEVLNVLLQVLDDGRLTDGKGRRVDFTNTVVVMTSNLGSHYLAELATRGGAVTEGVRREVTEALRQHFRPEFLNRIDETIVFHPLGRVHMSRIIDIQVARMLKRLADRKIHVELTQSAKDQIVEEGYDPVYGARPLKRTLQRRVLDPLAMRVLEGEFREGDHVVVEAGVPHLQFVKRVSSVAV
jgi:ATP-dependent Clp protease ATP-binding subunit ClpB